jgi:putative membrane protein
MKKVMVVFSAATIVLWACNNDAKDSVEKADSANKAKIDSPETTSQPIKADEESASFMVKAADGGMTEVQLGQLAQNKAVGAKVKNFASMMVQDHSAANDQVKGLARQRNVTLPDSISDDNKKKVNDLSKKTGKAFDKAYMDDMVKGHESTVDLFEKSADKVNDSEVKTFINNMLPKIKMHLDSARAIRKSLK